MMVIRFLECFLKRMNLFFHYSYMTQTDLSEDPQFTRVDFRAAIVPDEKYSLDEEEYDESFFNGATSRPPQC